MALERLLLVNKVRLGIGDNDELSVALRTAGFSLNSTAQARCSEALLVQFLSFPLLRHVPRHDQGDTGREGEAQGAEAEGLPAQGSAEERQEEGWRKRLRGLLRQRQDGPPTYSL